MYDFAFLDFDGVFADSAHECFLISTPVFFSCYEHFPFHYENYKRSFLKYRGLVEESPQFLLLHQALVTCATGSKGEEELEENFEKHRKKVQQQELDLFEDAFFAKRRFHQSHLETWLPMTPLFPFGKRVQKQGLKLKTYIITTKNASAVRALLDHYGIIVEGIFDKESVKKHGNKGKLISFLLDNDPLCQGVQKALFVDDLGVHLQTVTDSRVDCYHSHFGYGKSLGFSSFTEEKWQLVVH